MKFENLIKVVQDEPVFDTGLLLSGQVDPNDIRRQLTRWTNSGRLFQLRRGLYSLAPPYQKVKAHPFVIANRLVGGSYVSLQSALANYGLIPEFVPTVVSVCSSRPRQWSTPLGSFLFRHVDRKHLHGYQSLELGGSQSAVVALPEKALLDLIYLTPGGDSVEYIRSLRIQNFELLRRDQLREFAQRFGKPKMSRAADILDSLIHEGGGDEE
jgi:predicted transcriptional regulator of viral defense system